MVWKETSGLRSVNPMSYPHLATQSVTINDCTKKVSTLPLRTQAFITNTLVNTCDILRDLVPFVQLKNVKNTHGGALLLVKLQAESCTLNCTNGTKSRQTSHMNIKCSLEC